MKNTIKLNENGNGWLAMMLVGAVISIIGSSYAPAPRPSVFQFRWYDWIFLFGIVTLFYSASMYATWQTWQREDVKKTVFDVLEKHQRGVYKRIDENRELLELLQQEAPELLNNKYWIEGWLESQDDFLCDLAQFVPSENPLIVEGRYPRPWPGKQSGVEKPL